MIVVYVGLIEGSGLVAANLSHFMHWLQVWWKLSQILHHFVILKLDLYTLLCLHLCCLLPSSEGLLLAFAGKKEKMYSLDKVDCFEDAIKRFVCVARAQYSVQLHDAVHIHGVCC